MLTYKLLLAYEMTYKVSSGTLSLYSLLIIAYSCTRNRPIVGVK